MYRIVNRNLDEYERYDIIGNHSVTNEVNHEQNYGIGNYNIKFTLGKR